MTEKITEDMAGCWLDGHHGWMNNYRVVHRAQEWGFEIDADDEWLIEVYILNDDEVAVGKRLLGRTGAIDVDPMALHREVVALIESAAEAVLGQGGLSDKATEYLDSLAPEGMAFNWDMGELCLLCLCQIEGSEEYGEALESDTNQCARCDERARR